MGGLILIGLVFMVIGMFVQWRLKSKFTEYAQVGLMNGLSGAEIAQRMLRDNGIYDVRITQVEGMLTDHYNPADKTVNLSADVYHGRSVSAAAVAAHECGHAVQHKVAYAPLKMRSALVPVVQVCSNILNIFNMGMLFLGGFIFYNQGIVSTTLLTILVAANLGVTLFALITLPVEFDASRRALAWVEQRGIVNRNEYDMAKDALWWAAMTYVVAALGALANLMYYVSLLLGRRSND
ncbi:MAG: zinc metallopeptidase [Runella zeae]